MRLILRCDSPKLRNPFPNPRTSPDQDLPGLPRRLLDPDRGIDPILCLELVGKLLCSGVAGGRKINDKLVAAITANLVVGTDRSADRVHHRSDGCATVHSVGAFGIYVTTV